MRQLLRCAVVVLIGMLALISGVAVGSGDPSTEPAVADEICGDRHDLSEVRFHAAMMRLNGAGYPSCATCHDNAALHATEGDPSLVGMVSSEDQAAFCRICPGEQRQTGAGVGVHVSAGIGCTSCHDVHPDQSPSPSLLRRAPDELCGSCHVAQQASFGKPYGHRLGAAMSCVSCHNPHGGAGKLSLVRDPAGEMVCVTCHAEKRGPFVFPHVAGFAGDCLSCHEAHGSANPKRLTRSRVDQLCLECHSPLTMVPLGSQPPSFHDLRSRRYRDCTVCHVAVHGSNSSPELLR